MGIPEKLGIIDAVKNHPIISFFSFFGALVVGTIFVIDLFAVTSQTLLTFSHWATAAGIVFTAIGGLGSYYKDMGSITANSQALLKLLGWSHLATFTGVIITASGALCSYHSTQAIQQQRQEARTEAAHRRIEKSVGNYLEFLGTLGNDSQKDIRVNILEYFDESYFRKASALNVYWVPNHSDYNTWYEVINNKRSLVRRELKAILNTYINFLDLKTIDLIEEILHNSWLFPPNSAFRMVKIPFPIQEGKADRFKEHINMILDLYRIASTVDISSNFTVGGRPIEYFNREEWQNRLAGPTD